MFLKGANLIEAEEYMVNYSRSNFPSDESIAKRFNLSRTEIYYMRHDLLREGKLKFVNGHFVPNNFKKVTFTRKKIKTPFVLEKEADGQD